MNDNFLTLINEKASSEEGILFIEKIVNIFFDLIKETKTMNEALIIFKNLEDIQFILARKRFKEDKNIGSFLNEFIRDFDRIDDFKTKESIYLNLKKL